jgi:hypothetical protein
MNFVITFLTEFYSKLLLLYPRRFRDEFAGEMQIVFMDSVNEAIQDGILPLASLCLRELGGLPLNILREIWHEIQRKETMMLHENILNSPEKSTPTGQVIIGSLPFFLFGLIMILLELPNLEALIMLEWFNTLANILFFTWLIFPAIGFGIGWVRNFPRWSYPYTGMAFILALYIHNASTPGLSFFGIPIFGRELWGWRAWIPLAVAFISALVISRSFRPFFHFFSNLWQDWSIPSYLLAGVLPLLVMIAFDEIDRLYSLYFMIVFAMLLVGMVVLYLRSQYPWQRVLVLTIGILAIIYPAALGSNSYWLAHHGTFTSNAEMFVRAGKVALIMLLPAWLELLRWLAGRLRTT